MWKKFKYKGRDRVAYLPPEGPAFQVEDMGEAITGFRAFNAAAMTEVQPSENRFKDIPVDVIEDYPELKLAMFA